MSATNKMTPSARRDPSAARERSVRENAVAIGEPLIQVVSSPKSPSGNMRGNISTAVLGLMPTSGHSWTTMRQQRRHDSMECCSWEILDDAGAPAYVGSVA